MMQKKMPAKKKEIGAGTYLYPMPTTLVGALVNNKPNFIAIAYCGIVQHNPPLIAVTLGKAHFTNAGIKEQKTFSVNIPSENMVEVTDYVGIYSGKQIDKSRIFDIFYGNLKTAPLIVQAPINLECRLKDMLDYGGMNEIFIGEIMQAYADCDILSGGNPDIVKLKPIIFSMHENNYFSIGKLLGKAWDSGKRYAPQSNTK